MSDSNVLRLVLNVDDCSQINTVVAIGLTIKAKAFLRGQREGKAVMYRPGTYPRGAIGPVQFMWQAPPTKSQASLQATPTKPQLDPPTPARVESTMSKPTKLWIWCHPAIHDDVLMEIQKTVKSHAGKSDEMEKREVAMETTEAVTTSTVTVESLKLDLVRFRLIGPRSQALLLETLKPVLTFDDPGGERGETTNADSAIHQPLIPTPTPPCWWRGELEQPVVAHSSLLKQALLSIKTSSVPPDVCKGSIIGMTVYDPRLFTPSKRTDKVSAYYPKKRNGYLIQNKAVSVKKKEEEKKAKSEFGLDSDLCWESGSESGVEGDNSDMEEGEIEDNGLASVEVEPVCDDRPLTSCQPPSTSRLDFTSALAFSPIWDRNVRDVVSSSKVPDHILNLQRQKQLVRSSQSDLLKKSSKIPVLLVHQSLGSSHQGSGWDLILPSNWAMPFWVSLVYHGARACGVKELQKCCLEAQTLHFPSDFPDTAAGRQFSNEERRLLEARYRRFPPDKRRNYGKLLIRQPFCCPWSEVVASWSREESIERIVPQPQVVDHEPHSPSKRIKLSSTHKEEEEAEPFVDRAASSENRDSLKEEVSRLRKRSLPSAKVTSLHATPTWYVLRSLDSLTCLHHFIDYVFTKKRSSNDVKRFFLTSSDFTGLSMEASRFFLASLQQFQIDEHLRRHPSAILAIKFETTQRGSIADRASLSLPTLKDLQLFSDGECKRRRAFSGPKEELNQKGMAVVDGDKILIGVSSLTRKEIKEVREKRLRQSKRPKRNGMCSVCACVYASAILCEVC